MSAITVPAGVTSHPHFAPVGSIVKVSPAAGASAIVEYTTSSEVGIKNGVATWSAWPKGQVSAETRDLASNPVYVRVTALTGTVMLDIDPTPGAASLAAFRSDWGGAGSSVSQVATISGTPSVGSALTAKLPAGVTGTLQWTRTLATTPFTKSNISGAVASAVNSLAYTVQSGDVGYLLGCDASSTVAGSLPVTVAAATSVPVLLQIATSTYQANAKAAATAFGSKTIHTASEALTAIKAVHANWYVVGGNPEQGTGSTATIKCTIEYPIGGTKTQFLYGGSVTGSCADLSEVESDFLTVSIPAGAEFAIYTSWANTGGVPYFSYYGPDGRAQGMSNPTPDLTVPGSTGNWTALGTIGATYAGPIGLVGMTTNKAVMIMGDSISVGRGDSNFKYQGFLGRAFAPVVATGHGGSSGDKLSSFISSHARRVALSRYYTHVAFNFGINDTTAGDSAATVQANTNTVIGYFTALGKKVALCTLGPVSTDTASTWAATGTQTTHATNAVRAAINTQRLTNTPLASVIYDINPAIENVLSPEDGLWKASGGSGQTADGTHENALGYANAAALINPTLLLNA